MRKLEEAALAIQREVKDERGQPIIKHLLASVGSQPYTPGLSVGATSGVNLGEVTVELQSADTRNRPELLADAIIADWRKRVGPIPARLNSPSCSRPPRGQRDRPRVDGPDVDELDAASEFVKAELATNEGVIDIGDSNLEGKREVKLAVTPDGEALGLRLETVARQVRQAFYGEEVQRLQRGRDEVRVFVRYPREGRRSLQNLADLRIRTPAGAEIPFSEVVVAEEGRGLRRDPARQPIPFHHTSPPTSTRTNPEANANEIVEWMRSDILARMGQKYPSVMWGIPGEQKDQRESVSDLSKGFVLALAGIFMVLALPLRSYTQPLIVMSVIPIGMIGGGRRTPPLRDELQHHEHDRVIALAGVVINESLVLVEFMNRYRREGHTVKEAVIKGGRARFTPIFLTSVTSFIGLLPMITETSIQAKFLIPWP